jgi:hypothetical protein
MGQRSDIVLIGDLAKNMLGRTFCPLGDAAALPTISIVEKFKTSSRRISTASRARMRNRPGWWLLVMAWLDRGQAMSTMRRWVTLVLRTLR